MIKNFDSFLPLILAADGIDLFYALPAANGTEKYREYSSGQIQESIQ